uniref:7TM_GPCR_Srx domain-containing protein n=1 Tax=Heterorhabditis bacteriophora TaxID=37862 RepID=A0A1I7W659_HETBA
MFFSPHLLILDTLISLNKSPNTYLNYKILIPDLDIFLNVLFQPVFFFPLFAGRGYGFIITKMGFSTFTFLVFFLEKSILGRNKYVNLNFMTLFFYQNCIKFSKFRNQLNLRRLSLTVLIFKMNSFLLRLTHRLLINLSSALILLGLICHMQYILRRQCQHLTVHTQELQKTFLRAQIIQ